MNESCECGTLLKCGLDAGVRECEMRLLDF